jgi:hypothetical protein
VWVFLLLKEQLTVTKIICGILAFAGVVIVIFKGDIHALLSMQYRIGDFWMLIAVASLGLYTICARIASKTIGPFNSVIYAGIFGIVLYLPFSYSKIAMLDWSGNLIFYVFHNRGYWHRFSKVVVCYKRKTHRGNGIGSYYQFQSCFYGLIILDISSPNADIVTISRLDNYYGWNNFVL